jgi:cysteate synthase
VLSTRQPAYSQVGGLFDALSASRGVMLPVTNAAAAAARRLLEEVEGVVVEPAGAVALASLLGAAREGRLAREAVVLLNITGGGRGRLPQDGAAPVPTPALTVDRGELRHPGVVTHIADVTG